MAMNKLKNLLVFCLFGLSFSAVSQVLFYDDFESGSLSNWAVRGSSAMVLSPGGTNKVPENGQYSMQMTNSANAMYAVLRQVTTNQGVATTNFVSVTSNSFKFSVWINDASTAATRVFAQMMTHTDGQYGGNIEQVFGIGKYNQTDVTNHVTGATEGFNGNKYQGRMSFGIVSGWFNLDAPGSPNRSTGWHLFEIEVGTNTVVHTDEFGTYPEYVANFYVDGILSKSYTNVYVGEPFIPQKWDSIVVGLGAGSTIGNAFYDGFRVVQGQPFFATHPEPQTLRQGQQLTLSARVGGASGVTYQWQKNGTNLPNATSSTLTINNAQIGDSGSYRLVASNAVDRAVSFSAQVTVNPLIMITVHPVSQRVNAGGSVTFSVAATGAGTLQYQWFKNGQPLTGERSDILTIDPVLVEAAGSYTVEVSNGVDPSNESNPAELTVNTAPSFGDIDPVPAQMSEVFTFAVPVLDDFSEASRQLFNFEGLAASTNSVLFRAPNFSGSTIASVDTNAPFFTRVTTNTPGIHGGTNVLHVNWTFRPVTATSWLRLTTSTTPTYGNPTISVVDPLRFDIYAEQDVYMAIGVRETGTTNAIGANGGATGGIEFIGSTNASTPKPVRLIPSNTWTTVEFDFPNEQVRNFASGNGTLDTSTGRGVLEHIAFVPVTGGVHSVYLDNFTVMPRDPLRFVLIDGPQGATIDAATGVITWLPTAEGNYELHVGVTDSGGLTAATIVEVQVGGSFPPGPLSISRNGSMIRVSWEGAGTLQATSDLSASFEDVASQSPYEAEATGTARFFRVRR